MSGSTLTAERSTALAIAILRVTLGVFLLIWGLEKFVLPEVTGKIFAGFYGVEVGVTAAYALGAVQSAIAIAIILGLFPTISYGLGLALHAVTFVVTFTKIIDPWGLISGSPQHLFLAALPVLGGSIALFLLRKQDTLRIGK